MKNHIILAAFGTTTRAKKTYARMDSLIRPQFTDCRIHWVYSSPTVRRALAEEGKGEGEGRSLSGLLELLGRKPNNRIVVQSVHVLPGNEFHRIVRETRRATSPVSIGMPLLASPVDYLRVAGCLKPLFEAAGTAAVLLLGHGTSHPAWTAYPALEQILRREAGTRVFVAALEKFPDCSHVVDDIAAAGFTQVYVIPFLLVAGMHFQRDITADDPRSWRSRLARKNIRLTLHDEGLGLLPGIADIFCHHIRHALTTLESASGRPPENPAA